MSRAALRLSILSAVPIFASLHTLPAAAQDLLSSSVRQALIRPGVFGPGVSGISPQGEVVPGGDIEAQTTGPDGNVSMRLVIVSPATTSGGSGIEGATGSAVAPRPYVLAVPFDPSRMRR